MQLSRDARPDANLVTGLDEDGLKIGKRRYASSVIVSKDTLIDGWQVSAAVSLTARDLEPVLELEPEVVLLGTGARIAFPDGEVLAPLMARGIGVEVMDTAAACRTYNLLLTEGRHAVAALIVETNE